jgi:hypothetical protein
MSPAIKPDAPPEDPESPTKPPIRLLFIEDSENDVLLLLHHFRNAGYAPTYLSRGVIQRNARGAGAGALGPDPV